MNKFRVGDRVGYKDRVYDIKYVDFESGVYCMKNTGTEEMVYTDAPYIDFYGELINRNNKSHNKSGDKSATVKSNAVDHPSYYQGKIEVIDFIEDKGLGFNLGNCVKYISRAGKKNPEKLIEDLKKARWYLDREIKNMEKKED